MANRRMFSKAIIESARFLKMPSSTRLLYYDLGMRADDDGVVEAFTTIRMTGASEDDLKILAAKNYVRVLNEDLVTYITDWQEHNKIRADRKIDSMYQDLLLQLIPEVSLLESKERADRKDGTSQGQPKDSVGKVSLGQDSTGEVRKDSSSCETIEEEDGLKEIMFLCQRSDYKLRKVDANKFIESYGIEKVKAAIVTATSTVAFEQGKIKSYKSYLASILNDISKDKKVDITITKESKKDNFNNFKQRELDIKDIEENILGWH